ncbi:unnamed protein product [Ilex paraguariensis]|uniref:Pentatricopeptide repeat-containing protein n=1 Tax=Ilex paraguariensis TaxID=185542 RepID=A0ABC8QTM4_9AQUA
MRKLTSIASRSVQLVNADILSYSQQFLFSVITPNYHSLTSNGETTKQQRLIQLLQEPSMVQSLETANSLHALTITMGSNTTQTIFLYNNIMSKYIALGAIPMAHKIFDEMPQRNVVSYNTMITAYCRNGEVEKAWCLFFEMRYYGFEQTQFTFGGLLSCSSLEICRGSYVQALIIKSGLLCSDAFAGTALLVLFGRHGFLEEAIRVFDDMPEKTLVTWNSLIALFGQHGFVEESVILFRELMSNNLGLSEYSFVGALSGFLSEHDIQLGEQIHGLATKIGFCYAVSVVNSLINMYMKCSGTNMAEKLFEEAPVRDVVSWNTIMGALAKSETPGKALQLFSKIYVNGVLPNETTFVSVINSCASLEVPMYAECIHAKIIKNMFESNAFVGTALVDFYAKFDNMEDAHRCFNELYEKNLVSWNALIQGYSNRGCSTAVSLVREMIQSGYRPNEYSFSSVFKASLALLELQQLHSMVIKIGYIDNDYVSSSLISSYAKNGLISDALISVAAGSNTPLSVVPSNVIAGIYNRAGQYHKTQDLFSLLEEPDIVSWNILIAACSRNGDYKEVFELFHHMQVAQVHPDNYTYVSLLSVCTKLCNLALGSSIHGLIIKTDFECCDTFVCNVMIDMYSKCGNLENSVTIFNEMAEKNVISWTALVSALGLHGRAHEALKRFKEMEIEGFEPDGVAFISVLSACRHVGLVTQGMELFWQMKWKYGVEPQMDHYLVAVDLLTRYGHLKEAEQLIGGMPFPPDAVVWRTFLEGCKRRRTV